jgi:endonuclease-3 related protein
MKRPSRLGIASAYRILMEAYGPQGWWPWLRHAGRPGFDARGYHPGLPGPPPGAKDRLTVCLGAILTQNAAWTNAEKALGALLGEGLDSLNSILSAPPSSIAAAIRPSGYFKQKTKKIIDFCRAAKVGRWLGRSHPPGREDLLAVWGIGPETADSILLYAFGRPVFVVDAYTRRLFARLGLMGQDASYDDIQEACLRALPLDAALFNEYHALIVDCGKRHCAARPRCRVCPLESACPKVAVIPREE